VMNPHPDDQVSAVALIVESENEQGDPVLDVEGTPIDVPAEGAVPAVDDDAGAADDDEIGPAEVGDTGATAESGEVDETPEAGE
jgi:DNA gyrase subunit A